MRIVLFPVSNLVEGDKTIHHGVNSKAGDGMDVEFAEYVLAVGQDCIDRDEKFVCHILVAHAARNANDYFAFAFGERFVILVLLERLSLGSFHQEFHGGEEKVVFNAAMQLEILLTVEEVEKNRVEQFVRPVAFVVFNNEIL